MSDTTKVAGLYGVEDGVFSLYPSGMEVHNVVEFNGKPCVYMSAPTEEVARYEREEGGTHYQFKLIPEAARVIDLPQSAVYHGRLVTQSRTLDSQGKKVVKMFSVWGFTLPEAPRQVELGLESPPH